ncbi:MAG: hypothetical protein IJK66_03900 [Bacilli bacterium]|nr:hypothetical protein [Bacilli bacterium]
MGLFDKLKNVFIEEDFEDDDSEIEKKEVKSEVKIEEVKEESKEKNDFVSDDTFSDRELLDTKEKFKFPIIFEDDDFKEEKKNTKSVNVLDREVSKYDPEIKKDSRKEKKTFKPSPVISPVYGVLDKNYSKEDITIKDGLLNDASEVDIDYVIKKASGEYTTREEKNSMEVESTPIELFVETEPVKEDEVKESTDVDEKIKSIDELLKDTTDDDFYSLVDSMYKDEEGDGE